MFCHGREAAYHFGLSRVSKTDGCLVLYQVIASRPSAQPPAESIWSYRDVELGTIITIMMHDLPIYPAHRSAASGKQRLSSFGSSSFPRYSRHVSRLRSPKRIHRKWSTRREGHKPQARDPPELERRLVKHKETTNVSLLGDLCTALGNSKMRGLSYCLRSAALITLRGNHRGRRANSVSWQIRPVQGPSCCL